MNDVLKYENYYASVHFSTEDEVFYGKILGINDLISFEGASVNELKEAFKEAVIDYIETCQQIGKEPDKTYKGTFNVRVSPTLHREASIFASSHNMTLNDLVKHALAFALGKQNKIKSSKDGDSAIELA